MSRHRGRGWNAGAWLALAAMLIQALIPNLIAAEITLAAGATAFEHCAFGHVHAFDSAGASVSDERTPAASLQADERSGKGGLGDACSICIALYTIGHFTTPGGLLVPAPPAPPQALQPLRRAVLSALVVPATYDARAPPLTA